MVFLFALSAAMAGEYYYMNGDRRVALHPVEPSGAALRGVRTAKPFTLDSGERVYVASRIVVRFSSLENLDLYEAQYGLQPIRRIGKVFLFETGSVESALNAANALEGMPDVVYAQPDILKKRRLR